MSEAQERVRQLESEIDHLKTRLRSLDGKGQGKETALRAPGEKEAEHRIRKLEAILRAIGDAIVVYGPKGEILQMNPAAERLFDYTQEQKEKEMKERLGAWEFMMPSGRVIPLEDSFINRALQGEAFQGKIFGMKRKSRTIWVSGSASPVRGPQGELLGAVLNLSDITHFHDLQEKLKTHVQMVTHDLNTPLTVIRGHADYLLKINNGDLPENHRISLEAISRSAVHMSSMIEHLVEAARLEDGALRLRKTPIDLQIFLQELGRRYALLTDEEKILIELPQGVILVNADPSALERILANLLDNALKYSAAGTAVVVSVATGPGTVKISVEDRGPGIEPGVADRLFDRYYRAPGQKKKGLGLGLYITRLLVEAHGGEIGTENRKGGGSIFTFTLPGTCRPLRTKSR